MWGFRVQARNGHTSNPVVVGVIERQRARLSARRQATPEKTSIQLSALRGSTPLAADIRSGEAAVEQWQLRVEHSEDEVYEVGQVMLSWERLDDLPEDVEMTLIDIKTGLQQCMRDSDRYFYQPDMAESGRHFEILAKRGQRTV